MKYGPSYQAAMAIQAVLLQTVNAEETEPGARAMCARAWVEIEREKREMRGVPRLKAVSFAEMVELRDGRRCKRLRSSNAGDKDGWLDVEAQASHQAPAEADNAKLD